MAPIKPRVFQGGEALPAVGTPAYLAASGMQPQASPYVFQGGQALPALGSQAYADAQRGIGPAQPFVQPNLNNPINVNQLGSNPYNLMQPTPQTQAVAGQEYVGSIATSLQSQLEAQQQAKIDAAKPEVATSQSNLTTLYQKIFGQADRNEKIYEDNNVDDLKSNVDRLSSEIEADQLATRRQIERLREQNPDGVFGGSAQAEENNINRAALSRQADRAILLSAANRQYDTASSIADRRIEAETEGLQQQLSALEFFYKENKDTLTKAEDKQFQLQLANNQRQLDEVKANKKLSQDIIIEASSLNAPESILRQAQQLYNQGSDPAEIAQLLGGYSKLALDAANTRSIIADRNASSGASGASATASKEEAKLAPQRNNLLNLLGQYKTSIEGSNLFSRTFSSTKQADLTSLRAQIAAVYKDYKKLGTLDAGVERVINGLVGNTGISKLNGGAQVTAIENAIGNIQAEDPNYVPPQAVAAQSYTLPNGTVVTLQADGTYK